MKTATLSLHSKIALGLIALCTSIVGGIAYQHLYPTQAEHTPLWQTPLSDEQGQTRRIDDWKGKVRIINFWATWCPPCKEEIPHFITTQNKNSDIQVLGLAIDQAQAVYPFAQNMQINYPVLIAEQQGLSMMKDLGNPQTGLPFTVMIDAQGQVISTHQGIMSADDLQAMLKQLQRPSTLF